MSQIVMSSKVGKVTNQNYNSIQNDICFYYGKTLLVKHWPNVRVRWIYESNYDSSHVTFKIVRALPWKTHV